MTLSGRWGGYWEQAGWGRQPMRLTLRMGDGRIEGEGDDCIGPFTFLGRYDAGGHVTMIKQYIGRHQLLYDGMYDGEGTIFGHWFYLSISGGPFALRLETVDGIADMEVETLSVPADS